MKQKKKKTNEFNRRDFLKGSSAATLMGLLGGVELVMDPQQAKAADADKPQGPPVKTAVIGLGARGREIVSTLARWPEAEVVGLCDADTGAMKRASKDGPPAASVTAYRQILDNK